MKAGGVCRMCSLLVQTIEAHLNRFFRREGLVSFVRKVRNLYEVVEVAGTVAGTCQQEAKFRAEGNKSYLSQW